MSEQIPCEGKSFKELYEDVCKERSQIREELQESRRRIGVCTTEREELQGMYNDMEGLSTRLSDKLEQNQKEYSQAIVELQERLDASEGDLASVKSENAALQKRLEEVEQGKTSPSSDVGEAKSSDPSRDPAKWLEEKEKLQLRANESDRAVVLLSSQLEKSRKSRAELKRKLKAHLRDEEKNSATLSALHAQLQQCLFDLSSATEEKKALGRELGQSRADHRSLKAELAEMREERSVLNERLELIEGDKSALEESKIEMEKQVAEANEIVLEWEESLEAVERERDALLEENGSRQASLVDLSSAKEDKEALNRELGRLQADHRSLEAELVEMREALVLVESDRSALEESKAEIEKRLAEAEGDMEKERNGLNEIVLEWKESLEAAERERDALLEENSSLRVQNYALEKQRGDADVRATDKADAAQTLSEEKYRLSSLLLEARKSLATMKIEKSTLENSKAAIEKQSAESEREIKSRAEAEKKSLGGELSKAKGRLETVEAQKWSLEELNATLGERIAESEKRMEKERSDLARLLLKSEESLKAVESERNALLEANGSLNDRRAEAETDAEAPRTRLEEPRALSQGWEEEKARLIGEKHRAEKEKMSLRECVQENVELEREMLADKQELMIRQEGLEKLLKDALVVTTIGDGKENSENPKLPKRTKKNKGLVLGSIAGSPRAPSMPGVPSRPPFTPTGSAEKDPMSMRRRVAIDP